MTPETLNDRLMIMTVTAEKNIRRGRPRLQNPKSKEQRNRDYRIKIRREGKVRSELHISEKSAKILDELVRSYEGAHFSRSDIVEMLIQEKWREIEKNKERRG